MWEICLWFEQISHKNEWFALKMCLTVFIFLCPRANRSFCSSIIHSFFKSQSSDLLLSLFTKEPLEHFSQVPQNRERFALVWSFAHIKWVISSKNRWANSQPWFYFYLLAGKTENSNKFNFSLFMYIYELTKSTNVGVHIPFHLHIMVWDGMYPLFGCLNIRADPQEYLIICNINQISSLDKYILSD